MGGLPENAVLHPPHGVQFATHAKLKVDDYYHNGARRMMESGALDPLRDFSEACHEELSRLSSQALQFEYRRA